MPGVDFAARLLYFSAMTDVVSRCEWGAAPPKLVETFNGPAPFVIIHHSYIPGECHSSSECIKAMQNMQKFHQNDRGWNDIGYSFGVGGDGNIYMGRGFSVIGAHAPRYNDKSVGICLIGDWREKLPPEKMLQAVQKLIQSGVEEGYIAKNYTLLGHRQVRDTECPGQKLFDEIKTWPHFSPHPSGPNDTYRPPS
uniref:Peptidoglycan-recognition protein n=1 Tax=Phlebotomus papatasi TaxID=29031 RepID=A8D1K9_PHLPP|nr:putative peptidoglycan recognition protein [Phlebotomus papatasi]